MPQTYMRAIRSGAVATTAPRAVSCSLSAGPVPGRVGSSGAGQDSTTSRLERPADGPVEPAGEERMEDDEYLPLLRRTNARFAEAAAATVLARGWTTAVPGYPGWSLADLVAHLAGVQHFWAWVVRTRAEDPTLYAGPGRVADDELLDDAAARSAELETVLDGTDPAQRVWTWARRQDVGFVLRRQALEAVVHTADVELV